MARIGYNPRHGWCARRDPRRRLLPRARGPVRDDAARRPRGHRGQGRAAGRRRRHAGVGSALRRRRTVDLLPVRQPQQGIDRPRPRPCQRTSSSPVGWQRRADVLVENHKPGSMARFGLGYDDVAADNPGIVYCSISGFGSAQGRELPGYDLLVQAMGGLMSITGTDEPTKAGVAVVDVLTGLHAAVAVLGSPASPGRDRPWPAHRGHPARQPAVVARQPGVGLRRGRHRPRLHGQCAPVDRAVRGLPDRGSADGHRRRQRRAVRPAGHGAGG